jgi:RNase P protein component
MVLLRKSSDAIVRRAGCVDQRREFGESFHRHQGGTDGQRGTRHAIRHPNRNRRGALVVLAKPDLAPMSHAALHENRLAMQRMPEIVDGYFFSVVGGM